MAPAACTYHPRGVPRAAPPDAIAPPAAGSPGPPAVVAGAPPGLPAALRGLLRPQAYPHPVTAIQVLQTHMSWVLLTGDYVYKLKRPVRFAFADFSDPAHRARLCAEELRLNRRYAPSLYLDVVAVRRDPGSGEAHVGPDGPVLEYAVRMRQFDRRDELAALVPAGAVDATEFRDFGVALAAQHRALPQLPTDAGFGSPAAVARTLRRNLAEWYLQAPRDAARLRLRRQLALRLRRARGALAARHRDGHVRECHGDLHLSNLVRLDGRITPFDALEFEPAFRHVDVADEVAFLAADLRGYGRADLAHAFLDGYLDESGDYDLLRVLDLYLLHRALVRAKVMAIRARDGADAGQARQWRQREADFVELALRVGAPRTPRLLLMHGPSGSGKSWLARQLAPRLDAVHLRSDRERKRLAGLAPLDASGSPTGGGLYARDLTARTYARLLDCARAALAGGHDVICDATFLHREQRAGFAALAAGAGAPAVLLQCHADDAVLRSRIRARRAAADDASEADESVLDWQRTHLEPHAADEGLRILAVDTGAADPLGQAMRALQAATPAAVEPGAGA